MEDRNKYITNNVSRDKEENSLRKKKTDTHKMGIQKSR